MADGTYKLVKENSGGTFDEKSVLAENGKVLGFDSGLDPVMITPISSASTLLLDQTTPQTVINGRPTFGEGFLLDTSPTVGTFAEGKVFFDALWRTMGIEVDTDVTIQVGQETQAYCLNNTGSPLVAGNVVYISGASGGYPTIALADNSDVSKAFVLGVVTTASIADSVYGHVTIRGHVNGLNTNSFNVGDSLYLGDTAGTLATSISAGRYEVRVGRVMIKDPSVGRVYVNIRPMQTLNDISDVVVSSAVADQVLRFNGTEWVNGAPVTSSASAGIEFYNSTPVINSITTPTGLKQDGTAGNGIQVASLSKTPVVTAEQTIVGQAASDTRAYVAWLYDTALGRTTIDAGTWDFTTFAAVNSVVGGRVTTVTRQIYQVVPVASGSVTTSGVGANTRTATITSSQFAGTYFAANATNTVASYLQTPSGIYQISAISDVNTATIIVPTGYSNENAVTFNVWNKLFGSTSPTITSTGTNYLQYDQTSVQGAFAIAVTDKFGQMGFITSNNTTSVTVAYNGTTHSTHFSTPLITLHDNLAGLNAAGGNYQHFTDAQKTVATQAASTSVDGYLSSTDWNTFNNKQAALTKAAYTDVDTGTDDAKYMTSLSLRSSKTALEVTGYCLSDETTALTTGEKLSVNVPFDFKVTRAYATCKTAPTDSDLQVDIEDGGTTILNAVLTIAASGTYAETSTFTGAASSYQLHKNDLLTFDVDQIGSTIAGAGLKVFLEGYR